MQETNQEVPDSIIQKIQKLLALKNDESASQGEIENATNAITAMLLKYNLDMSTVENHKGQHKAAMTENQFDLNGKQTRHEAGWVNNLFNVICIHNLCKCITVPGYKDKDDMGWVIIVGKKHNIDIVYYMVDQLITKIRSMAKYHWRIYHGEEKRNTYLRGYYRGAVHGLHEKLNESKRQIESSNPNMGLMVINNGKELMQYVAEKHGPLGKSRSSSLSGMGGYAQGKETGKSLNVHKGVNDAQTNKRIN